MLNVPIESHDACPNQGLADMLRVRVQEVGMLPGIATQALQMVRDPDCTIRGFAHVVERDVKLAFEVMRLANSSVYGFDVPVASFEEAVFRLGFRQCKNLILASCFSSLMRSAPFEEEWIRDVLWRHSYLTGIVGVHLNRAMALEFQGEEFTAGLLHDFGRMLIAVLLPHEFAEVDLLDFVEDDSRLNRERDTLGTDHAELGAWYAADNSLPAALVEAVRWHHEPASATKSRGLVALTAAADHIANHLQRTGDPSGYDSSCNLGMLVLEAEYGSTVTARCEKSLVDLMQRALDDVRRGFGDC